MFDWRHELSHHRSRRTTSGPSGSSSSSSRRGRRTRRRRRSTGARNDKTVLANEQVINGRCERCGTLVEQRMLEQWFFRITEYADRLLANLDDKSKMDWSDSTTTAQRNWIGRSEGAEIDFPARRTGGRAGESRSGSSPPGPTRSSAPRSWCSRRSTRWSTRSPRRSSGRRSRPTARRPRPRTWSPARWASGRRPASSPAATPINPATGKPIPVWIADYVLMEYGTGAIMAVPGHDERDFEFATKFGLPIVRVLRRSPSGATAPTTPLDAAVHRERERHAWSTRASSTACPVAEAKRAITAWLAERGARARPWSATGCTTGASRASATGARRSRSSTATSTAPCRCRRRTCRSMLPDHRGLPARRHRRLAAGAARGVVPRARARSAASAAGARPT